ncbi:WD40/YVTN/BNR-like repeat-containing protein [Chitinophaga agri]|uniref:Oxidoreductase n=1 Tax=Chitinophaga agri TaxID=2703787 RepID=A0A6B9ZFU8_9BACT|nr:hypothetical protein [Chitinophaga agri]QHS59433.1 hypothetical protein GWR21_07485 [Chitinophaga agri]
MHNQKTTATVKVLPNKTLFFTLTFLLASFQVFAQLGYRVRVDSTIPVKSIRALSIISQDVAWAGGTEGKVGRMDSTGKWHWNSIPGYDTCDWRSLVAFNDQRALVLNAGEPAHILLTENGGESWKEVYTNTTKGIFFDGMAFKNAAEGMAIGDPVDGKFTIIRTKDSGKTWQADPASTSPAAKEGEAIFAASNTSLRILPDGQACFVTGGKHSRFIKGWDEWKAVNWDFTQGEPGKGAFSVAFADAVHGVAVGGDYTKDTVTTNNCLITKDGGKSWRKAVRPPAGYRSCVQHIQGDTYIATGTSGTDISNDGGLTWSRMIHAKFHVLASYRTFIWLAGSRKIGMMRM